MANLTAVRASDLPLDNTITKGEFIYAKNDKLYRNNSLESKIDGALTGFKGSISIADTPASDGYYFANETGTYTNAGSLTVDLSLGLHIILVSGTLTVFEKIVIPISSSNFLE